MESRAGLVVFVFATLLHLTADAAPTDCGPHEDAERTSHRALAWADFQGPPPEADRKGERADTAVAQIHTSLRIDALSLTTEQRPEGGWAARVGAPCVRAYMLKQLSGRTPSATLPSQLAHEQRHFDLTRVYALRLRVRLAGLTVEAASAAEAERGLRAAIDRAYRELQEQHQRAQRRYDRKTQHGQRRTLEARWFAQLEEGLAGSRSGATAP